MANPVFIAPASDAVITNFDRQLKMANAVCTVLKRVTMKREPRINLPIKKPAKVDQPEPRWQWSIAYFLLILLFLWGWQDLFYQLSFCSIPYTQFNSYLPLHYVPIATLKHYQIHSHFHPSTS